MNSLSDQNVMIKFFNDSCE